MESTLGLEIIEVVEQAAIASSKWMGKGEKNTADHVAVEAMAKRMNKIHMPVASLLEKGKETKLPCSILAKKWVSVPKLMPNNIVIPTN
ncbi:MAG UNVERIFIED_CONTAM: fructose-bisphosphatase class II [Microcystis novacekii LVE1205-3]